MGALAGARRVTRAGTLACAGAGVVARAAACLAWASGHLEGNQ